MKTMLREVGIAESDLPKLAADAMIQQRLLVNNTRAVTEADACAIYRVALETGFFRAFVSNPPE